MNVETNRTYLSDEKEASVICFAEEKSILSPDATLAEAISVDEAKDRVAAGIRKMFREKQHVGENESTCTS